MWNVERAVAVGEMRKANTVEYQVEWDGEERKGKFAWEPASALVKYTKYSSRAPAEKEADSESQEAGARRGG